MSARSPALIQAGGLERGGAGAAAPAGAWQYPYGAGQTGSPQGPGHVRHAPLNALFAVSCFCTQFWSLGGAVVA